MDLNHILATSVIAFFSNAIHLVPLVLMELLILINIFGQGFFSETHLPIHPIWIWCALLLLLFIFIRILARRTVETEPVPDRLSIGDGEHGFFCPCDTIEKDYGSMKNMSLLSSSENVSESRASSHTKNISNASKSIEICSKAFNQYCGRLRPSSDLLVLSIVGMLLWHCWPLLRVLYPLSKTSLSWVSTPNLVVAGIIAAVIVHFLFVR
mmetsp:Transcript_43494/g.92466  ORF Transcript_43494/g.92466 Transcript_43494/m.92466 type:complete len:210 (-) Transcript_43494:309-938(-)